MIRVLIISDNKEQYDGVRGVFSKLITDDISVEYRHSHLRSSIWEHKDFKAENSSLNIKNSVPYLIDNFDLIISVHCKQLFPRELIENVRCINIHPGYNPINRGWFPQVFAIINQNQIGATIHEMDAELDNGPIIIREFVDQYDYDTSYDIYKRVLEKEIELFRMKFFEIMNKTYKVIDHHGEGKLFLKKDFNALCEIDLDKNVTYRDAINQLRALTHDGYKNAFFTSRDGKKVYVSVSLEVYD